MSTCRCGHDTSSDEPHPCHGNGYTCKKPSRRYFYQMKPFGSSKYSFVYSARDTWACEECWAWYQKFIVKPEKDTDKENS